MGPKRGPTTKNQTKKELVKLNFSYLGSLGYDTRSHSYRGNEPVHYVPLKPEPVPKWDPERLLKIANVLGTHPTDIQKKFNAFPSDIVPEISDTEITPKYEKSLISDYHATFNPTIEMEVLLKMYKCIHLFRDPHATGRIIK